MARVHFFDEREWMNWHLSLVRVPIAGRFELHNRATGPVLERIAEAGRATMALVGRAFAERRRLRAVGGAWSYSEVPANPGGWIFSTGFANRLAQVPESHAAPEFAGFRDGLFLAQCGVSVGEFNRAVESVGRSLRTSGASNGQTFVGAMATGTHGSAIDHPGIQGQVRGFQLIPAPDRNLWVEPASAPATDGRLAASLGATVVRDDRLFAAALVGLGAFGIIHAVLVETAPIFLLAARRAKVKVTPGLLAAMRGEGFQGLGEVVGDERPWFFQSVLNRHIDAEHAYVTVMHRRPWDPAHVLDYQPHLRRGPGYNTAVVVANLLEAAPGLTSFVTKKVLADQLRPMTWPLRSWGQAFNFTTPRNGTAGAAVAVPVEQGLDALGVMERALKRTGRAPVAFACRYATASPGLLAFTRFPRSCIIDVDGIDAPATRAVMRACVEDLRAAGSPHAEHWGKMNAMTAASVRDAYGADLERWLAARDDLLDRDGEWVFGSAFLDRLGLWRGSW